MITYQFITILKLIDLITNSHNIFSFVALFGTQMFFYQLYVRAVGVVLVQRVDDVLKVGFTHVLGFVGDFVM